MGVRVPPGRPVLLVRDRVMFQGRASLLSQISPFDSDQQKTF
jgi:hypothetical protein